MEEWKEYRLGEISFGKGSYGIAAPAVPYDKSKYTYLRITDINDDGSLNFDSLKSVDEKNASKYLLHKGDIVFARTGNSTGRTYYYDGTEGPLVYAGFLVKFSLDSSKVNPRLLKYYTHSKPYYEWIHSFDTGATRGNINAQTFGYMPIMLPPRSLQDKIVEILESIDDKIDLNRKINSNLEEQAKALFKSWFIDFEPFKDGKFVDSELGKIPEGWKVVTIGEVTDNIKVKVGNRDSIKVLSPVTSGHLVLSEEYFSKQVFSSSIAKYIVVKHNDFAYNPARINIGSIGMNEFEFDGCVSPVYVVFRCQSGYEYFFDLYRRTSYFIEEVKKRAIGGVRQTLSYKDLSLIQLVYPPKKVVDAFNFIYISFIHGIHSNDVSNKKLEAIRDTLLPKLMSGEIDVK